MAWRSTLQASRREVKSPSRSRPRHAIERTQQLRFARRDRTVHRHAVDLLELGQVLVQHLGAGLERRARRLVALVLAAPLAADACVVETSFLSCAVHSCGRRRPAVELHGPVGQRDTLLHHGRPGRRSGREGVGGHSHQCDENLLHLAIIAIMLSFKLLCSVPTCKTWESSSFFLGRRSYRPVTRSLAPRVGRRETYPPEYLANSFAHGFCQPSRQLFFCVRAAHSYLAHCDRSTFIELQPP